MSFLVRDMIELGLFNGARIVAGHKGIGNVMRWVNIMEILDMPGSVQEHELLITTAYNMEDEQKHKDLLAHLKARGACGIAIQPGYYISAIPTYILREAERLDFPVIELPHDLTFSHITHVLLECIADRERDQQTTDKNALLTKLAQWEKSISTSERAALLESCRGLFWLVSHKDADGNSAKTRQLSAKMKLHLQQKSARVFLHAQEGGTLIYAPGIQIDQTSLLLLEAGLLISEGSRADRTGLLGGVSILLPGQSLQKGLDDALEAADTIKGIGAKQGLCPYQSIGLLKLLGALGSSLRSISPYQQLSKLLTYDKEHNAAYVKTLRAYLISEGNASACAQMLFIHRHTLKNRLDKIDEICGVHLNDYYVRLQLSMELMIYDLFS